MIELGHEQKLDEWCLGTETEFERHSFKYWKYLSFSSCWICIQMESYEYMAFINKINNKKFKWRISADSEVVEISSGLQLSSLQKFNLSILLINVHEAQNNINFPEQNNMIHPALVERGNIILLSLYLKCGWFDEKLWTKKDTYSRILNKHLQYSR